ncbi:MAG: citramalate synthase [Spirochaetota bacterium]|nr:citramalate synthase [Spirochaetota bacterium]
MKNRHITIYDTTLRDGAQSIGISFSLHDKIRIAMELDKLKIDYIEGGWPGSNPKDNLFFNEMRKVDLHNAKLVAFGSTRRHDTSCSKDKQLNALIQSNSNSLTIVAKSSDFQVTKALRIDLKVNLELIYSTVAFLKDKGFDVFLDAEHFYDGFKSNPEYSLETIIHAEKAGADMIVLCDTNGGSLPHEVEYITTEITKNIKTPIGVHFHNDSGVAVANSITAIIAGAVSVQGTMNGYGERCGNCDLSTLIPNIVLKMGYQCQAAEAMIHLTEVSRYISETANLTHNENAPYVGHNSFASKAGIHVSALKRDPRTYEHIDPAQVGNKRNILISELSGRSNIEFKAKEMGIDLKNRITLSNELLQRVKELEDQGFQFEAAEGSFELLIREATKEYVPFFNLLGFRVITEKKESNLVTCEATIKVEVGGKVEHTAANGEGPIQALDNALRKALEKFYPELMELHLTDYKVRVLNEKSGTGSPVRVLIDQQRGHESWGTVGVSKNIIEASWQALVDGIEYMLFKKKIKKDTKASNG